MDEYEGLSHTKWECKFHVVFIPKARRVLYRQLRQHLCEVFRRLAEQKERGRRRAANATLYWWQNGPASSQGE